MARTNQKKSLSPERILRVAVKHADKKGIQNLDMRTLAGLMDTGPMSLYHYFSNKDELLDDMVEFVAGKIHQPKQGTPWREAVTEIAVSAHDLLIKHAWVAGMWSNRTLGPARLAYMESILRVLRQGGFSVSLACDAYHAITVHVEGFALQSANFPVKSKDLRAAAASFLDAVEDPDSIPYFVEHVTHHMEHLGAGDQFRMMLEMILDGFKSRLDEAH